MQQYWSVFIAGKILEDTKVISDYKIEEKNFVVVMVTKVGHCIVVEFLLREHM